MTKLEQPDYLVYGPEGVTRFEGGVSTKLVSDPVVQAFDDFMGGVVFQYLEEHLDDESAVYRRRSDGIMIQVGSAYPGGFSVALLHGRPSLIHASHEPRYGLQEAHILGHYLITDLVTGHRRIALRYQVGEYGVAGVSAGGEMLAGTQWGSGGADMGLRFFDLRGNPVPVPEEMPVDAWPCFVDSFLSPDGQRIAWLYWKPEGDTGGGTDENPARWFVGDVASGRVMFEGELEGPFCAPIQEPCQPTVHLGDFDGRFLALQSDNETSTHLIDATGALPPNEVPGHAVLIRHRVDLPDEVTEMTPFWTVILDSLPATPPETIDLKTGSGYDEALIRADERASRHSIETVVVPSDDYSTLNPGYWVVHTGIYRNRDQAAARCAELQAEGASCYPRYVAARPPSALDLYRYGEEGLFRVQADDTVMLADDPIETALDDGAGGVVFARQDGPGWEWLPAGADSTTTVRPSGLVALAAPVQGRPVLLGTSGGLGGRPCTGTQEVPWSSFDLASGKTTFLFCHNVDRTAGGTITSFGGDLLTVVTTEVAERVVTNQEVRLIDITGDVIDSDPLADSCEHCLLEARLSPDGSLLAYSRMVAGNPPGVLGVFDLETGADVWRMPTPRFLAVSDFDGRYVVTQELDPTGTYYMGRIHDSAGIDDPAFFEGFASLAREPLASPPLHPKLGVMTDLSTFAGRGGELGACSHMPGRALSEDGVWHPAMWANAELIDLGVPWSSDETGSAWAQDANTNGQVVGTFVLRDRQSAFLWEAGQWTELWLDGAYWTDAVGINNSGQVAVVSFGPEGLQSHVWQAGHFTLIGTSLFAQAINEAGQVAGYAHTQEGTRAFLWAEGTPTYLSTLGGTESMGRGLGEDGSVLGWASIPDGQRHAFHWADGVMTDLGTLGGDDAQATAVNRLGQVVGSSNLAPGAPGHAFLWEDGTMYDLGTLGGTFSGAGCVDDTGVVTGTSETAGGDYRPFVWRR